MSKRNFISFLLAGIIYGLSHGQWQSELVRMDDEGMLSYVADQDGFKIPDFSYAGYAYGEKAYPFVAVVKEISPILGDNTSFIQNAIDQVGLLEPDERGIRGALLLKPGTYEIHGKLYSSENGVIIRGTGEGSDPLSNTVLRAMGNNPHQRTIIRLGDRGNYKWDDEEADSRKMIMNDTVPVGSRWLQLEETGGLSVGENIIVFHPCTSEWLESVNGGDTGSDPEWTQGELPILFHRYIKTIKGDSIELDAPVFNPLIRSLSESYIYKPGQLRMKRLIGIENLRLEIETEGGEDENHAWDGIRFNLVEDGWARNCTVSDFGQAGFVTQYSYRVSIDNCSAIDPVAIVTGERMYNFNFYHGSQLILVRDSYARNGRHHYISNGTSTVNGCVVYNSVSDAIQSATEGHRKWTTGLLFDNLKETNLRSSGRLVFALYNRGDKGTAHGWSSAFCVAWNCDFSDGRACVQKPPGSQNYAIGCQAKRINGNEVDFPQQMGYVEGLNQTGIQPSSLYIAQLEQRIDLPLLGTKRIATPDGRLSVYPNPSEGDFTINGNDISSMDRISIFNSRGQMVFSERIPKTESIIRVRDSFEKGIYFIRLEGNTEQISTKIIIN